jgi:hypothetical protein
LFMYFSSEDFDQEVEVQKMESLAKDRAVQGWFGIITLDGRAPLNVKIRGRQGVFFNTIKRSRSLISLVFYFRQILLKTESYETVLPVNGRET